MYLNIMKTIIIWIMAAIFICALATGAWEYASYSYNTEEVSSYDYSYAIECAKKHEEVKSYLITALDDDVLNRGEFEIVKKMVYKIELDELLEK